MGALSKTDGFRVIISGGGIAGLSLANALQHADIDYVLLESRTEIAPQVGASIGMMPNGSRILDQLGCYDEIVAMTEPLVQGASHHENGEYIGAPADAPRLIGARHGYDISFLDRQFLLQVLYDYITDKSKILLDKRLSSVDHYAKGVTAHCVDGSSYEGHILAGADGVFSTTRQEMWRVADQEQPGATSIKDKTSMRAEYQCLFGISKPVHGLQKGNYDVTSIKDFSTMVITGKDSKVYWFLFKRMDQVYTAGNIPRFSKKEAEALAERYGDVNLMPKQSVKFRDVWKERTSYTLVATEEAEYTQWTWGRIACLGDSIHKMTPNAGAGGNACIESAAALANSIKAMMDKSEAAPSMETIKQCLLTYQQKRDKRTLSIIEIANKLTRIHAIKEIDDLIAMKHIVPNAGDTLIDMQSDLLVGAIVLDYLPPPPRSLKATLPFNPEQGVGKKESIFFRALLALPFLGLVALAVNCMAADGAFPAVGKMIDEGSITWDGGSVPVSSSFYQIKWLDDIWRPVTIIFAPWNFAIDPIAWWQMITFITDFGVLYSIVLIESARRANKLTLAQIPIVLGLSAQLRGIGVVGPGYFFMHYMSSQISNFKASDMRLTNLSYTRTVLPSMIVGFYIPHFLSFLHPSFEVRHNWNWIWQMFPVWTEVMQQVLKRTVMPDTVGEDRIQNPSRDLSTIRFTIGACVVLSGGVWIYTLTMSPYSPITLFLPQLEAPQEDWIDMVRHFVQYDELFCFGSALLWLGYLFNDLKHAGMVQQSWISIIAMTVLATMTLGPGAAVGLGWLWREDVLAHRRHKGAVIKGWVSEKQGSKERLANGHAEKANGVVKH